MPAIVWLRRDLRLRDHPALTAAARDGNGEVLALFVLDPHLLAAAGPPRRAFLLRCLRDLDERLDGRLTVVSGDPPAVVAEVARDTGATAVHVTADFAPYGRRRDTAVERALAAEGRALRASGSPYAAGPGSVTKPDGSRYAMFTPFRRAWDAIATEPPLPAPDGLRWIRGPRTEPLPDEPGLAGAVLPAAGEDAALRRLETFLADGVGAYARRRNLPGADATSHLSPYLKFGTLHPRTVLACLGELPPGPGAESFRTEVAWRDFYADVLCGCPDSAWRPLRRNLAALPADTGGPARDRFAAWARGSTGYPIVDAGMRQLLHEGWMHNRVRMIVASFLVKDLHLPWQDGARHFLRHLVDGDLASNSGGWQWVAGTGTDSAPSYRIFNPVKQGEQHDPEGTYVRRHVHELRDVPPAAIHRPWTLPGGPPDGYPPPIVDHDAERREALARYAAVRGSGAGAGRGWRQWGQQ